MFWAFLLNASHELFALARLENCLLGSGKNVNSGLGKVKFENMEFRYLVNFLINGGENHR